MYYLVFPDDEQKMYITSVEPQPSYTEQLTAEPREEPQLKEHPAPPFNTLETDDMIEFVLNEEQYAVRQGIELVDDHLKEDITIFYDLVTVYEQIDNIKQMLHYVEEVKLTFGNEIEWVKFRYSGWAKYTITIKGNMHKISFANAITGLFNKAEVVEINYED